MRRWQWGHLMRKVMSWEEGWKCVIKALYQQCTNEAVVQKPFNHQLSPFELKECFRENHWAMRLGASQYDSERGVKSWKSSWSVCLLVSDSFGQDVSKSSHSTHRKTLHFLFAGNSFSVHRNPCVENVFLCSSAHLNTCSLQKTLLRGRAINSFHWL